MVYMPEMCTCIDNGRGTFRDLDLINPRHPSRRLWPLRAMTTASRLLSLDYLTSRSSLTLITMETPSHTLWQVKLVTGISKTFRSKKSYSNEAAAKRSTRETTKLKKRSHQVPEQPDRQDGVNELGEREYSIFSDASTLVEPAGQDHTDLVHSLSMTDEPEYKQLYKRKVDLEQAYTIEQLLRFQQQAALLERLPDAIWQRVVGYLDPGSAASLAMTSKSLYRKIGFETMWQINQPHNRHHKNDFLNHLDLVFPRHLLCFHCTKYHLRLKPGKEMLKIDHVANPIFICPRVRSSVLPRMRLAHGRELPYAFVQLALRGHHHSLNHGITPASLDRHWKCKESTWSHRSRFMIVDGRLAVRIRSQCFAPPDLTDTAQRHLLYDREEYIPYFSVCSHWKDGELMDVCKCMLSHVPRPPKSYMQQLKEKPIPSRSETKANFIVSGCDFCRPARRCLECPSEYMVELQMVEDVKDPVQRFKHALIVTRWMDLGDGSSPFTSPQWVAICGNKRESGTADYESFTRIGRRAIAGQFESLVSGTIPGQRLISLNPKKEKRGTDDNGWY